MERRIITICGSYKFTEQMYEVYRMLTDLGDIVLMPAIGCAKHEKEWYMQLHFDKIKMSDIVFIVDVDGYIGESTRREIEMAEKHGKMIRYYSDMVE